MQPLKYVLQNDSFSVSVLARGFRDWFVRIQAATTESHISFLHASPVGEAKAKVATKPGASTNVDATNIQRIAFTGRH